MIYIVEMLRWGDAETHHYIIGCYDNENDAVHCGNIEKAWRDGKYDFRIVCKPLNTTIDDKKLSYEAGLALSYTSTYQPMEPTPQ